MSDARLNEFLSTKAIGLVNLLRDAETLARSERARVDDYVIPIFKRYRFPVGKEFRDGPGEEFVKMESELFLCSDESILAAYHIEVADAHAAHGFKGKRSECPALMAEYAKINAEDALIQAVSEILDFDPWSLHGKAREKLISLFKDAVPNYRRVI